MVSIYLSIYLSILDSFVYQFKMNNHRDTVFGTVGSQTKFSYLSYFTT